MSSIYSTAHFCCSGDKKGQCKRELSLHEWRSDRNLASRSVFTFGILKPLMLALFAVALLTAVLAAPALTVTAWATPEQAALDVRSAILLEMNSGRILYEQNADDRIPPASLTKVLTMFMAFEQMGKGAITLDETVKISRKAARTGGSRMALKAYESVPMEKLLLGMAVSSGNDATAAVAERLGGSQEAFVAQMNAKASQLGMARSYFRNPHGLPAQDQVTTARDMLILSWHYLRSYPQALRYHATRYMRHNGVVTYNKNPLLNNYDGADGLKTGWVRASGYNLISTVEQDGTRLLAVVMGAENSDIRGRETHRLIEAGFMVARGQQATVTEALPRLMPTNYAINTHKTAREAYAVLAPESLGKAKAKQISKKQKVRKQRKNVQQARKNVQQGSKSRQQARKVVQQARKPKSKSTQAASLPRRSS